MCLRTCANAGISQGSSTARTFLALPGWKVRGITRDPQSESAQNLATEGVELVRADLDDRASLLEAFRGASAIFVNTDFFLHLFAALEMSEDQLQGQSPNQYAYRREVEQNLNAVAAASDPSVLKTLDRLVLSSLGDARTLSGGKFKTIYHFDSKAEVTRVIKSKYPEIASRMSCLHVGHYVTNWKAFPMMAPQKQADGTFLILRPFSDKSVLPFIDAHRDVGRFVKALVVDVPPGKELWGVSQHMTGPEWTKVWGDVLGVSAAFKQVSFDEFFDGVPGPLKSELADTYSYVEEYGYGGGDPNLIEAADLGVHVPVTPMAEYIKGEDWSSVLNAE